MNVWVYLLGELPWGGSAGLTIKVGKTSNLRNRLREVNNSQTTNANFILLAAAVGTPSNEASIKEYFEEFRVTHMGSRREYFSADSPIINYAAWLRGQWWAATDGCEEIANHPLVDPAQWLPSPDRQFYKPSDDPSVLVQTHAVQKGSLREPYSWFPNPQASFQDYFTPSEIIECAKRAMGGIDLDAAGHWAANKVHRIPDYFDVSRSAFVNDWHGRVWLNPPYGNNAPWFERALSFVDNGKVEQMCMLSPVWAFTTQAAKEFTNKVSAMVLLSPTPKFWGNIDPNKQGSNHPHAVVYIGNYPDRFIRSFSDHGIPMVLPMSMLARANGSAGERGSEEWQKIWEKPFESPVP